MKTTSQKQSTTKVATVVAIYRFTKIARICFSVKSSRSEETFATCFNGDAEHGTCGCAAHGNCYHLDQLRPIAQAYFEARIASATSAVALATVQHAQVEDTRLLSERGSLNNGGAFSLMR